MKTLPSGNLKDFCADVYPHLSARALKTEVHKHPEIISCKTSFFTDHV